MVHNPEDNLERYIPELESEQLFTRTFLRLDTDRRQAVLEALFDEVAEKGPDRLNIKQVAERSGASIGSLYQYFGNREKLLQFAVRIVTRSMTELFRLCDLSVNNKPLRAALREYIVESVRLFQAQKSLTRFLTLCAYQGDSQIADSVVEPIAAAMLQTVRGLLTRAKERGELRPDTDLEATARAINVLLIALGDSQLIPSLNRYWMVSAQDVPFERTVDAALDMTMRGIGAGGAG